MWLRIASLSDIAYIRGVPQAVYRVHADSMLRSMDGALSYLRERRVAFDNFFASSASRLDAPDQLRATVARTLARQALWRASRAVDRGEGDEMVDEYVEFAVDVYSDARSLREWRGLALRRRIGSGRSLVFFPFIATAVAHRLHYYAGRARWRLSGV
jgi:hypothetical protein